MTKQEEYNARREFYEGLSDNDVDSLIGELCSARKNNLDVGIVDNISNYNNSTNLIEQEEIDIKKDAEMINDDILKSIFESDTPLSQEEMNELKAKGIYAEYMSKFNNNQEDNAMQSIEEEIRNNLARDEESITEVISEEKEVSTDSFPEETESNKESDTSDKDINTNENKKSSPKVLISGDDRSVGKKSALASAMAFPNFVSGAVSDMGGTPYGEESLEDVAKELVDTVDKVTSVEGLQEAMAAESKDENSDDDREMTIEEFNDVPATELSVPDDVLTSALMEKYDNVDTQDALKLIEVMNRYKSGEKFNVFEALPDSLKQAIAKEAMSVGADKATINFFAKSFINDLVNNTYLDEEIKDFNKELKEVLAPMNNIAGTIMDEYSDEVYHKFTNNLEDKANEIQDTDPDKANELREVSKAFNDAISLKRVCDIIEKTPSLINKAYKNARDNWTSFRNEYDKKVSLVSPSPRTIQYYETGLYNTKFSKDYSPEYMRTIIVLVANTVLRAVEENTLTEHVYAYYASNAMYTIAFTANNSEVNNIVMNALNSIFEKIDEYMSPLLARNSKKNRKRNKKK